MNHQQTTIVLMITAAAIAVFGSYANSTQPAEDQLHASFERELHHTAGPAAPAKRSDVDEDVLYELINKPLQSD